MSDKAAERVALVYAADGCTTPLWTQASTAAVLSRLKDQEVDRRVAALARSRQLDAETVREVLAVMTEAPTQSRGDVLARFRERRASERFEPPTVVVAGELELVVDTTARITTAADVAEALEPESAAVQDAARLARLRSAPGLPARIADEALATLVASAVESDELATISEDVLVAHRRHVVSDVFGDEHVLARWHFTGDEPLPAYVPLQFQSTLPLLSRFPVLAITEVHPGFDSVSFVPSLRVMALARIVGSAR